MHGVCSLKMKLGASVLEQTLVVCDDLAYDVIMGMDMIFSNHITMEMLHSGVGLRINGELVKSQWQKEREDVREQAVKVAAVEQCNELKNEIWEAFPGCFTRKGEQLRQTSKFEHKVEVFGAPVKRGHYSQSPRKRQILRRIVQQNG